MYALKCYLTRFGPLCHVAMDDIIGRSLATFGQWAPGEVALMAQFVQKGQTAIDVGANIGYHSLFLHHWVGTQGRVIAFEPDAFNHKLLEWNMLLNQCSNVQVYKSLAGNFTELSKQWQAVPMETNRGLTYFTKQVIGSLVANNPITVQLNLDSLQLPACHFIKIDVEGAELAVIKGAGNVLKNLRPTVLFEQNNDKAFESILQYLHHAGYKCYWSVTRIYSALNIHNSQDDYTEGETEVNVLAVPREHVFRHKETLDALVPVATPAYEPPALSQLPDEHYIKEAFYGPAAAEQVKLLNSLFATMTQG